MHAPISRAGRRHGRRTEKKPGSMLFLILKMKFIATGVHIHILLLPSCRIFLLESRISYPHFGRHEKPASFRTEIVNPRSSDVPRFDHGRSVTQETRNVETEVAERKPIEFLVFNDSGSRFFEFLAQELYGSLKEVLADINR